MQRALVKAKRGLPRGSRPRVWRLCRGSREVPSGSGTRRSERPSDVTVGAAVRAEEAKTVEATTVGTTMMDTPSCLAGTGHGRWQGEIMEVVSRTSTTICFVAWPRALWSISCTEGSDMSDEIAQRKGWQMVNDMKRFPIAQSLRGISQVPGDCGRLYRALEICSGDFFQIHLAGHLLFKFETTSWNAHHERSL